MRRLEGGERERHLRAKDLRNLRPRAVLGQPRRSLGAGPVRPRSKAKSQDAALVRRKARGVTLHAQGPAIRARPGVTRSRAGLA